MDDNQITLRQALPDLLSTQLLAANVYAAFVKHSRGDEQALWKRMLLEELAHIRFLAMMIEEDRLPEVLLPEVKTAAFLDLYERAQEAACESPFERTLWGLRLEHAEIDFGLESLAANTVGQSPDTPVYPGPLQDHYSALLDWAGRYRGAHEIAIQIARIEEHLPQTSDARTNAAP